MFLRSLMPNSTADQITFEKTPNYYRLPVVPDRIRNFNRTIKLVYVTCDPVRRTLSDFFHIHRKRLIINVSDSTGSGMGNRPGIRRTQNLDPDIKLAGPGHKFDCWTDVSG